MAGTEQSGVRVAIPPPALFFGFLLVGVGLQRVWPITVGLTSVTGRLLSGLPCFALAFGLGAWSLKTLQVHGENARFKREIRSLVTCGPYSISRNPLYLALVTTLVGFGAVLDNPWLFLFSAVLFLLLDRFIVQREEKYLTEHFGESFRNYSSRVRRWV